MQETQEPMQKDWFWWHGDLTETTRMFKDHEDFITFVNLLGYNSGIRPKEVSYGTENADDNSEEP